MKKVFSSVIIIAFLFYIGTQVNYASMLANATLAAEEITEKISEAMGSDQAQEAAEVAKNAASYVKRNTIIKSSLPFAVSLLLILGVAFVLSVIAKLSKKIIFIVLAVILLFYLGVFSFQTTEITKLVYEIKI